MQRGQNINIKESLKEVDSDSPLWLWRLKDFSGGSNCRCCRNTKRKPKDVTELLQSHDKTLWRVASYDEQREWFLGMESTAEDAMKITERTTKDLEYYIDLVDKTAAGFERLTPIWTKLYCGQILLPATEKSLVKGRANWCGKLHYCLI